MPSTEGETLSGKKMKPVNEVRGHVVILVAGFSHDAGVQCGPWMKAIEGDEALKQVSPLELAMLEKAPGMLRGMIKGGMRKGLSAEEEEKIVVMTQDQEQWEKFFGVGDRAEPYVLMLNAKGDIVWRGHGQAGALELQLRNAMGAQ